MYELASAPPFLAIYNPEDHPFDTLLVERHKAREKGNYILADAMRGYAELYFSRTINDTQEKDPTGGRDGLEDGHDYQQYRALSTTQWLRLFGKYLKLPPDMSVASLIKASNTNESRYGKMYLRMLK